MLEKVARRLICTLPQELSRHGVERHTDATRRDAGDHTMIIPSLPQFVQAPGQRWHRMAPLSSPSSDMIVRAGRRG
jgi:hypothetical protein